MLYLSVLLFILVLAFRFDICKKTKQKDEWYYAVLVILILMAGFRYRFSGDTVGYTVSFYYRYPTLWKINWDSLIDISYEPAWFFLNSLVKSLGGKWFVVQIIQACIVNTLFFVYFKKHSDYPFLCVFLFYIIDYHYFNMMIMRNAIAMAICLFANDYFLEKKWRKAFLLYGLAFMFHISTALIIVFTFLLIRVRLNKTGVVMLISMLAVSAIFLNQFSAFVEFMDFSESLSGKLENYEELGMDQKGNINYYLGNMVIPMIYTFYSLYYVKKHSKDSDLLKFEPFVMIGLSFVVMRMNLALFHRFTKPYDAYFIMFYVQFFMCMVRRHRQYVGALLIISPLFATNIFLYTSNLIKYSPYYSVFDMTLDEARESSLRENRPYTQILDPKKDY